MILFQLNICRKHASDLLVYTCDVHEVYMRPGLLCGQGFHVAGASIILLEMMKSGLKTAQNGALSNGALFLQYFLVLAKIMSLLVKSF